MLGLVYKILGSLTEFFLLTLVPARISNYIHYEVWNEIAYQSPNFNGAAVKIGKMNE